ncbi:hypothetical protein [Mycolicibacterium houstonense]|uniref:hypothetical protein n=1 Tax=Mycolicibacterium houstonense TaxID=146021 RepID=UPI00082BCA21|nr:hypothetical protein [Mycolicibacterium houstonense]
MTVHVRVASGEQKSYTAADNYEYDEQGILTVLRGGDHVASYPHKEWIGVVIEERVEEVVDAELVPRVWQSIRDVPAGIQVRDRDGDVFVWVAPDYPDEPSLLVWSCGDSSPLDFAPWGDEPADITAVDNGLNPFTEVIA